MAAARVVEWAGGLKEVQLPRGMEAPADYEQLVRAAMEQAAALERGELRRVRKQLAANADRRAPAELPRAAAAVSTEQRAPNARRATTATDYAGWELALQSKLGGAGSDDSDADGDGEEDWELQAVTEEERLAAEARAAALASADAHRERGNAAFKRYVKRCAQLLSCKHEASVR
jgi:hypothetical protein